jgi:ankyrin repeat protein
MVVGLGDNATRATMRAMGTAGQTLSEEQADRAALNLLGFELHTASAKNDVPAMRRLVDSEEWIAVATKIDFVNWVNPSSVQAMSGHSALHIAAQENNAEAAKYLIEQGANLNLQSKEGFTPLMRACDAGVPEMCEFLLENGANPDMASNSGSTALVMSMQFDTMLLELVSDTRKWEREEAAQEVQRQKEAEEKAKEERREMAEWNLKQQEQAKADAAGAAANEAKVAAEMAEQHAKLDAELDAAKVKEAAIARKMAVPGKLTIDIVQARGLHAHDKGGTSDPFVVVSAGQAKSQQTKVVKKTLVPEFGEQFTFDGITPSDVVSVVVKDKDVMSSEVMGLVDVALGALAENSKEVRKWYPLTKKKAFKENKQKAANHGSTMVVEVVQARRLHAHDKSGFSDPFVVVSASSTADLAKRRSIAGSSAADPTNKKESKKTQKQMKTKVIKKTLSPCWHEIFSFDNVDTSEPLVVQVKDKDMMGSELMGKVDVDLSMMDDLKPGDEIREWYKLTGGAGEVELVMKWHQGVGAEAAVARAESAGGAEASGRTSPARSSSPTRGRAEDEGAAGEVELVLRWEADETMVTAAAEAVGVTVGGTAVADGGGSEGDVEAEAFEEEEEGASENSGRREGAAGELSPTKEEERVEYRPPSEKRGASKEGGDDGPESERPESAHVKWLPSLERPASAQKKIAGGIRSGIVSLAKAGKSGSEIMTHAMLHAADAVSDVAHHALGGGKEQLRRNSLSPLLSRSSPSDPVGEEKEEPVEEDEEEEEAKIQTTLQTNKLRCAELLLLRGVDPNKRNDRGVGALLLAAKHGGRFLRIAQMIMGVPPNAAIDDHGSDSWWMEHGHSFGVGAGNSTHVAILDLSDHDGMTPLLWAARMGHEDVLEELLSHGLHSHHHSAVHHSRRGSTDGANMSHTRSNEGTRRMLRNAPSERTPRPLSLCLLCRHFILYS